MAASLRRQNFYANPTLDSRKVMTLLGLEYEFEWQVASVPVNGSVFLRIQTPPEKYTLVNFREVRHNQTFGFYRQYTQFDDSGATLGAPLDFVSMRADTSVPSEAIARPITGVVADPNNAYSVIPVWGAAGRANRQGAGGLATDASFRVIPPGVVVLLEFENQSIDPAYWYAYFKQWEVDPGAIPDPTEL